MHTNHRRKDPRNPIRHSFYTPSVGHRRFYLRVYSKKRRQSERQAFAHEEWDDLPSKYYRDFLYTYW